MSVKLIDNKAFYGYRVRRTVNSRLYQEYFSLKKNGKRLTGSARKRMLDTASRRDAELASAQEKTRKRQKAARCFHADGSVRGISFLQKKEKSGNLTPIFQVGIASELDGRIVCTSFSINAHGKRKAWGLAVATYARHKQIGRGSKLYQQLLDAVPRVAGKKSGRKALARAGKKAAGKSAGGSAKKKAGKSLKKTAGKSLRA